MKKQYTKEELNIQREFIKANHEELTASEIGGILGRHADSVRQMADGMGLRCKDAVHAAKRSIDQETYDYVDNHRFHKSPDDMAEKLGITRAGVIRIAKKMGWALPIPNKAKPKPIEENGDDHKRKIKNEDRPPAVYNQSGSPYGFADEHMGRKLASH